VSATVLKLWRLPQACTRRPSAVAAATISCTSSTVVG
jgi:hypothetical protein